MPAGPLGSVSAPSGASMALNGADNDLQAAKDKVAGDAPKKYDYSAHGVLGNIGHVIARTGNIVGDILDPAATSLIPNSDLYNAHKRAGDIEEVDKAQARQLEAQRESDAVGNEQANRDQSASQFSAGQPQRDATLAATEAGTAKTQEETKPLDANSAATLNHLYNSKAFTAGMSPEETTRLTEAHKTIAEMKARQEEFQQRERDSTRNHQDAQANIAENRASRQQIHEDTMGQHEGDLGRKVLDTAEKTYGSASQSADEMQQMIDGARSGNKVYNKVLPLEGALAINTSQGVKRINRTEVDQIAGAGSLFDKIQGRISGLATGSSIPKDVLDDQEKLVKLLRNGAYKNYSDTFDSAQKRYGLNNEEKKPGPGGASAPAGNVMKFDAQGNPL